MRDRAWLWFVVAAALAAPLGAAGAWQKLTEGVVGPCRGAALVCGPGGVLLLVGGEAADGRAAAVKAFDPRRGVWSDFAPAPPAARRGIHPAYQAAYDPAGRRLYCLTYPGRLYVFDVAKREWSGPHDVPALEGTSWGAMALDGRGRKLVVLAAERKADNLGWSRTVVGDLATGRWSVLPSPAEPVVRRHRELLAATEAVGELVGRIRLAWYRDPAGRGTAAEREALRAAVGRLGDLAGLSGRAGALAEIGSLVSAGRLLEALRAARALHRAIDESSHGQYPVPPSRRNSPLVFDAGRGVFVLFGGDHEDYLLNDTWVLDLAKGAWRRARPDVAPAPRAGHALVYLPAAGGVALYGGYVQNCSDDYGARPWKPVASRRLWLYDAGRDRWDVLPAGEGDGEPGPAATEEFYGYHGQHYSPPLLAAAGDGRLLLVTPAGRGRPGPGATWAWRGSLEGTDPAGRAKLGRPPDRRLYRTGRFLASWCEVPDRPAPTNLDALPANRWVELPAVPRNTAYGCRQRDWGTAVWDERNEQILLWGGGHCVRSSSSVIHYSPVSGRMVESYDADEPYSANGNGGYGCSLLGRPWAGVHSYNTYAYDPPTGRVVSARGFVYDPVRMDWLRREPQPRPFRYVWSNTVLEATPHGVVAWAQVPDGDRWGLWLYRGEAGWEDLKPRGELYRPYCDSEGMVYDSRRDRLILGWGGGYNRKGDGRLTTFDFRTRRLERILPRGAELGRIANTREMAYIDSADWVLFAEPYVHGNGKAARQYLRGYDCAGNRYFLLDAGPGPGRHFKVHGQGWCWDAARKLLYVMTVKGRVWALRPEKASARRLDGPPGRGR